MQVKNKKSRKKERERFRERFKITGTVPKQVEVIYLVGLRPR